jgi:hypothetical protein
LFAEHRGELTWSDFGADRRNEHRRLLLGKQLRGFFGLDGDPFDKPPDGRGWRTRFTVIPEDCSERRNFAIGGKEKSKNLGLLNLSAPKAFGPAVLRLQAR